MTETRRDTALSNYDLVTFFPCGWETPWRGHYLIKSLSEQLRNSKILCVENPVDFVISPVKHCPELIMQLNRKDRLRKVSDNLFIYRPWIFLNVHIAARISIFQRLNIGWIKIQLDKVLETNNFRLNSLIIWVTDPFQEEYLSIRDRILTVFDCYDEYADQSHNSVFRTKRELLERERRVLQRVDLTFVVSELLYENKKPHARAIQVIPNAVDISHFGKAAGNSTILAKDILHIPHPIIGFHGNLSDRIDIDLLDWLAERNKEWSFVLVGGKDDYMKNKQILMEFAEKENVYLLGNKPYQDLPRYLKAFDVCLIPFREDDLFSLSCSPLKLYEYLATGKPIVSTNLPGVSHFHSLIRIAGNKETFEQHINEALQEKPELHEERIKISEGHSWKKRAEEVIRILEDLVSSRRN